jgi:alpha-L-rhamnosidase
VSAGQTIATLATASAPPTANGAPQTLADLQRLFDEPPDDSRVMMRWWWFGPAVTKARLARELGTMKEGGIGGVEIQPVYPVALDDEARRIRNLPYLSPEFLEALRFASDTAHELGLRVDLTLGSGWPYGGPQVPIVKAAGRLRVERVAITAGARQVALPEMTAGEALVAAFVARTTSLQPTTSETSGASNGQRARAVDPGEGLVADSLREIADIKEGSGVTDGMLALPSLPGDRHVLLAFVASRTGMMVKRAAVGAEGYVLDHYDRGALDRYLTEVGEPLLRAFGPRPPFAIFCDSLEVFQSDWTPDFLQAFAERRGYDLRPHLPALVADLGPKTAAIRHDWGQTLTELLGERFLAPMRAWAAKHQTKFRIQGYGIPPATIGSNAHADLPEGEGWQWRTLTASRWASSASHIYGRPVTSSETWTWLHSPSYRATPLDMKMEADLHFLQGITQLIGHGWPYTAEGVEYPGWRFYAAGVFNDSNPWWIVMPDVSRYLQRVSFMLRQGAPVNDVALYLPTSDAWAHFGAGRVHMIEVLRERLGPNLLGHILDASFNIDFVDDEALRAVGRVEGTALVLGGNRYRAIVLPGVERLPIDTLRTIETFARGGGTVIATGRVPALAPGFRATDADHAQVREGAARLFTAPGATGRFVADESQLSAALTRALTPDVRLSPAAPQIGVVHRRTAAADIYFIVNTANAPARATAAFRVSRPHAAWWDPMTGRATPTDLTRASKEATSVPLDLEPYGSRLLVFADQPLAGSARSSRSNVSTGASAGAPVADLSTNWTVTFASALSASAARSAGHPIAMDRLRSWTEDQTTRDFSGTATYEKRVTVPAAVLADGRTLRLDFGDATPIQPLQGRNVRQRAWLDAPVREAAVVYINDTRAGAIWCPPYAIDVTSLLKSGENRLRILVGNLAINHMAARPLPSYRLLNLRYGERFTPQDMDNLQPVPAGLLGPIRLLAGQSQDWHGRGSP